MNPETPLADPNGPTPPHGAAAQPTPGQHIPAGTPSTGAVHLTPAPQPKRNRAPRGPFDNASSTSAPGAPALLELAAAYPMSTEQRRSPNTFVPDAQMLFHVLSLCDNMMLSTDRFTRSAPAWLPIVSQLYISILWFTMILKVYVNSSYGAMHAHLLNILVAHLRIDECLIPGPLVPFFQSLGAINGPFEWIGDIVPIIPEFSQLWNATSFYPTDSFARIFPIPAILLDQLHYFASITVTEQETIFGHFEWYRNIFSLGQGTFNPRLRLGPQLCGSLYATESQVVNARTFWSAALRTGITRTNAAANQPLFSSYPQLLGFVDQNDAMQLDWFQHTAIVMQKYCQYFNGSVPLKSISPTGIGAVAVHGYPNYSGAARTWMYPATNALSSFKSSRFSALREIPALLTVRFEHADHELEEQAEQYAIATHTNMCWSKNLTTQNNWTQVAEANVHSGTYWSMTPHRAHASVRLKTQYAQLVASRYHQQAANRV